jgi:hypothetical protein
MKKVQQGLLVALLGTGLSLFIVGCGGADQQPAKKPTTTEKPAPAEQPKSEDAKTAPAKADHPKAEHPKSEHPK